MMCLFDLLMEKTVPGHWTKIYTLYEDEEARSTPFTAPADAGKRLSKRLRAGVCTRLGKRLGTCHGSRRHLPSGQTTGV